MEPARGPVGAAHSRLSSGGILGIVLAVSGVVFIFLGWYGVSGRPTVGEEMPYLASGTIPGAAMLVAAAIMLTGDVKHRAAERTNAMMSELHALLVETVPDVLRSDETAVSAEIAGGGLVAGERGEHFHQADCALVVGKAGVVAVDLETIRRRGLAACPVCEPNDPGT
jgi:hypothetical protein